MNHMHRRTTKETIKSNRELFIQGDCQCQQIRESETWTARWCSTSNTPPSVVPTYSTLDRRRSEEWGWRPGRQRHRHRWSERSQASSCLRSRDQSSRKISCNWDFQFGELRMISLPKDDVNGLTTSRWERCSSIWYCAVTLSNRLQLGSNLDFLPFSCCQTSYCTNFKLAH